MAHLQPPIDHAVMRETSSLGPRATLLIRAFIGLGWIVAGLGVTFGGHPAYPPDDQRAGPFFWPLFGIPTAIIGAILLWTAIRDLRRRR
jgi:uncharacterized membrane protein YphA (DoxX/SURF4 family)